MAITEQSMLRNTSSAVNFTLNVTLSRLLLKSFQDNPVCLCAVDISASKEPGKKGAGGKAEKPRGGDERRTKM